VSGGSVVQARGKIGLVLAVSQYKRIAILTRQKKRRHEGSEGEITRCTVDLPINQAVKTDRQTRTTPTPRNRQTALEMVNWIDQIRGLVGIG